MVTFHEGVKKMYSPKIKEDIVPVLYRKAREEKRPMTKVVDSVLRQYLGLHQTLEERVEAETANVGPTPNQDNAPGEKEVNANYKPPKTETQKVSPDQVERTITLEMSEQQRRDGIRALDIAMMVMKEQGYHTDYLQPLRDDLVKHSIKLNGRIWKPYTGKV